MLGLFLTFWTQASPDTTASALQSLAPLVTMIVTVVGVLIAWSKLRPQQDSLAAQASKAALDVFNATVLRLEKDLAVAKAELIALENRMQAMEQEKLNEIASLKQERDAAVAEAAVLRAQLRTLT